MIGILRFPGSNCDQDVAQMCEAHGMAWKYLWHQDQFDAKELRADAYILPGGFSYGDALRAGALAARSPVLKSLREAVQMGAPVLGICNGFQILTEAQLLPGALIRNASLRFQDEWVKLQVVSSSSSWGPKSASEKSIGEIRVPIAHGEGRYYIEENQLQALRDQGQVWLQYEKNPNGSMGNIAGVMSRDGRVCGLMPHPERALWEWMGSADGWRFWL